MFWPLTPRSFPLPTTPASPHRAGGLSSLGVDDELFEAMSVESVDESTGIMRVWFLLVEGLTGAVALCPRRYQPPTLELLFELLRSININPGKGHSLSHGSLLSLLVN